jgi:hypothetical protein
MLTLIHAGWSSIRSSVTQGRRTDALARLSRLLARPDVPAPIAADAHRLAGELLLEAENYTGARRHLRAAAALAGSDARTYYLWALAHERDPHGCDRRAARRFRIASRLEPNNALYRAAFGRAAVRSDRIRCGVRNLVAAADQAPGEMEVVRVAIQGLVEADRLAMARRVLTRASFLCRGAARAREWNALVEQVRFATARREQRGERGTTRHGQDAEFARDGGRVVLPFLRMAASGGVHRGDERTRYDVVSCPRPHFPRLRKRRADR